MNKPRIGFSGLGLMGRAMVERLQDQGYAVTVLGHRDRTGIECGFGARRKRGRQWQGAGRGK